MSSKQTDGSQKEVKDVREFLPTSERGRARVMSPADDDMEAESQKPVEKEVAVNGIGTDETIQQDKTDDTQDSLQTESGVSPGSKEPPVPTAVPKRGTTKQRKESLEEYRQTFLTVPKLEDRKPVFISREVRDRIDEIVHRLGGRGRSVSGFIENLARHHLEIYQEDVDGWKKL